VQFCKDVRRATEMERQSAAGKGIEKTPLHTAHTARWW